jgi:serine/threonine-protein kinase
LYEALTGGKPSPTDCSPVELQKRIKEAGFHSKGLEFEIDSKWSVVLSGCLQADVRNRFAHAQQVIDLLTTVPVSSSGRPSNNKPGRNDKEGPGTSGNQFTGSWFALSQWKPGVRYAAVILMLFFLVAIIRYLPRSRHPQNTITVPSVAVMPVVSPNGNAHLNHLSDSITTALTNDLAEISGLKVRSQTAVRNLGKPMDFQSAGRQLDVDSIVAASVSKESDRLLLQIELVDAHTGVQIWGEAYNRTEMDLDALQKDIAQEIAFRLRLKVDNTPGQRIERQHATTPAARAAYLKGQDAMAEHSSAGFDRAVNAFQEAIDDDPHYALALAELANCYTLMAYNYNQPEATIPLLTKAKESAHRALRLDSTLAEAYASLGDIEALSEFDWPNAEQNYKRAVELNPAYLPAHISYALHLLTPLGRFEEARAQFAYADRVTTRTVRIDASLALASYFARRYDESIQKALSVKRQFPDFSVIDEILAENYLARGEPTKVMSLLGPSRPALDDARAVKGIMVGIAFAKLGQRRKALVQLRQIEASESPGFSLDYEVAALAAAVGDNRKAFKYLEKSYAYRDTSILFLNVDPLMDPLRSSVRFPQLLRKLNLH